MRPLGEVVAQVKFLKSLRDDGLSKGYLVPGKKVPLGRKPGSKIAKLRVGVS